jgi:hypothetical protein
MMMSQKLWKNQKKRMLLPSPLQSLLPPHLLLLPWPPLLLLPLLPPHQSPPLLLPRHHSDFLEMACSSQHIHNTKI